jgi:hypothetical protein
VPPAESLPLPAAATRPLPALRAPHRLAVAAALWALSVAALSYATFAAGAANFWLLREPMLLFAIALVVAVEIFSAVVLALQPAAAASLARLCVAPLVAASLPLSVWLGGIHDAPLALRDGVPLMTRHLILLGVLLYAGLALLSLRAHALPRPAPALEPAAAPALARSADRAAA